ncbi:hypothetical protein Aduo_012890 [Ancylostoma duodenale]
MRAKRASVEVWKSGVSRTARLASEMVRVGFDVAVKDQSKRKELHQEHINRRVLVSWVTITGLANPEKWKLDKLLRELAVTITKYPDGKATAFSWPTGTGTCRDIPAIRASVSYEFWSYSMSEGRKRLNEYNREHNTKIEINKELTQKISDGHYYDAKKIREAYIAAEKKVPEMTVKRDELHIGAELLRRFLAAPMMNLAHEKGVTESNRIVKQ